MEILKVEDLSFRYPLCGTDALSGVSFTLERGDFAVVCGATGSGKTTLLRLLKRELSPAGEKKGGVFFGGTEISRLPEKASACAVGFVSQRPEQQIVTDRVWHELAFGLENMGLPQEAVRRRVCEISAYFGIENWFEKDVSELSGGQMQLLNLAAVMVMRPEILILDEPTALLDPIAASSFISTLQKLNREFSLTVVIAEHRLEDVIPAANRLLVLDRGKLLRCGEPRRVAAALRDLPGALAGMPAAVRAYCALDSGNDCPLTVREGRRYIESNFANTVRSLGAKPAPPEGPAALKFTDVCFRYGRELPDVLRSLNLRVCEKEIFCILGENGSGKTTALCAAAGLNRIYSGKIEVFGKKLSEYKNRSLYRECLALLPQDVQTVFLKNTVREELGETGADPASLPFDLSGLMEKHPYDLSGGEQQLVALAKILAAKPRLLLLDEPSKGLDACSRQRIIEVIKTLRAAGMTVVAVTHDVDFAAACADRCALFFRGEIFSAGPPAEFFSENSFYTTAASRMTRGYYDGAVTVEDAVALCLKNGRKEARRCS